MFALFVAGGVPRCRTAHAATPSRAECVVEVSSRRILHKRNEQTRLPMASTTKILTAIVLIEDCPLDDRVTIPNEAVGIEGSSVYLRAGEEYTVEELLYGLMLRSGNDAATALAIHHSGSIEAFARVMETRAALLGATDSRFANPHGLQNTDHFTTARDLALISAHAMENKTFRRIVSTKYYEPRAWKNKNKMLWELPGAVGIKTGFTTAAGRCLVTAAQREGMTLVSVVLNSPDMYARTAELLENAFSAYRMTQLCSREAAIYGCRVFYDFFYPLTTAERKKVRVIPVLDRPQPAQAGEIAGRLQIMLENNLLFSQNLYMMESTPTVMGQTICGLINF